MGYACPVCGSSQADGEHLANHLAFAAMLHGEAHEAWLDERVPDWADRDPGGLAAEVVAHAEETDHETVFDDTTGGRPHVDVGQGHGRDRAHRRPAATRELDPETRRIVEEAVEMTRERRAGDEGDRSGDETVQSDGEGEHPRRGGAQSDSEGERSDGERERPDGEE